MRGFNSTHTISVYVSASQVFRFTLPKVSHWLFAALMSLALSWQATAASLPTQAPKKALGNTDFSAKTSSENTAQQQVPGTFKWRYDLGGQLTVRSVVSADGTIIAVTRDGTIHALNDQGELQWQLKLTESVSDNPAISGDGTLYITGRNSSDPNSYVSTVDSSGQLKWRYQVEHRAVFSPSIGANGNLYFTAMDQHLYALSPEGKLLWRRDLGGTPWGNVPIGSDGRLFVTTDNHELLAYSPDGELLWKNDTIDLQMAMPIIGREGTLYTFNQNQLIAVKSDGELSWVFEIPDATTVGWPTIDAQGSLFIGSNKGIFKVSPDGKLLSHFKHDSVTQTPTIAADGSLFYMLNNEGLRVIGSDGEQKWQFDIDNDLGSISTITTDGTALFNIENRYLYALASNSGGLSNGFWPIRGQNNQSTHQAWSDLDGDGVADLTDNCPSISNPEQLNSDGDNNGGDTCDNDDDNDGVSDTDDAFPLDSSETMDTDNDGTGNNADMDDDGDGLPDSWETENGLDPLNSDDAQNDNDRDGYTNAQEYAAGSDPNSNFSTPNMLTPQTIMSWFFILQGSKDK